MTLKGRIQGGVVMLEEGTSLPEGIEVRIEPPEQGEGRGGHSLFDIEAVSVGAVLKALGPDDDLLEEMLDR